MGKLAKIDTSGIAIKSDLNAGKAASDLSKTAYKAGRITFDEAFKLVVKYMELLLQIGAEYRNIEEEKGEYQTSNRSDVCTSKQKLIEEIGFSAGYIKQLAYLSKFPEEFENYKIECYNKKIWPGFKEFLRIIRKLFKEIKECLPLPEGIYDLIYADPPWKYDFAETDSRKIENQYPTMEVDEICEIKLPEIAEDALLLIWATAPKLIEALKVIESWGFKYKTNAIWNKEIIGMGYWFRGQHELLLVATKGNFKPPSEENRESSIYSEKRIGHSKKPEHYYQWIEKSYPNGKAIELFARQKYNNYWDVWGNESI